MNQKMVLYFFLIFLTCTSFLHSQEKMKIEDILSLKSLGYTNQEMLKDFKKNKTSFENISPQDFRTLKRNGVEGALLKYLQKFQKKISIPMLISLLKKGKDPLEIIQQIYKQKISKKFSPMEVMQLKKQGVPFSVIIALTKQPLGKGEFLLLAKEITTGQIYMVLIQGSGLKGTFSPKTAVLLLKKGVPSYVLRMLHKQPKPNIPISPEKPVVQPVKPDKLVEKIQWKTYEHPARQFKMSIPINWKSLTLIGEKGRPINLFTPTTVTDSSQIQVALTVQFFPKTARTSPLRKTLDESYNHYRPSFLSKYPKLKLLGDPHHYSLGSNQSTLGKVWFFAGNMDEYRKNMKVLLLLSSVEGNLFALQYYAPAQNFSKWQGVIDKIFHKMLLRFPFPKRRLKAYTPQEIIEKYKRSVVSIYSYNKGKGGVTGTGFIIHSDGYLLTNHHVVWNRKAKAFYKNFKISWDSSLGTETVMAKLVGSKRKKGSAYLNSAKGRILDLGLSHQADVALLKIITPSKYIPLPISPIGATKLGDPCVAIGFPKRSLFQNLSLFVTQGVVVRFNRDMQGRIHSVYTDAKITHGNSGGPCINLITGGVLGLNTFGYDIRQKDPFKINDLVGYYGVTTIDTALKEFPQNFFLPREYQNKFSLLDYYQAAYYFAQTKALKGALYLIDKALERKRDPNLVELKGLCLILSRKGKEGMKLLEENLKNHPTHYGTLFTLARANNMYRRYLDAIDYLEKAIQLKPSYFAPYLLRGQIYFANNRPQLALKDVKKVLQLTHNYSLKAYLLGGKILYSQKKYDEGKKYFELAIQVNPSNISAALGMGRYYEKQSKWNGAILEYGRISRKFPNSPTAFFAIGSCYMKLKQYENAYKVFSKSFLLCKKNIQTPPAIVLMNFGWIDQYIHKNYQSSFRTYLNGLNYYYRSSFTPNIHMLLSRLFQKMKLSSSISYGHYLLSGKWKVKDASRYTNKPPLTLKDLLFMVKYGYRAQVMIQLVRVAPLQVTVRSKSDMEGLQKKGIPKSVAMMIYLRTKKMDSAKKKNSTIHLPKKKTPIIPKITTLAPKKAQKKVSVKIVKYGQTFDGSKFRVLYEITNKNLFPIYQVQVKFTLKNKTKKILRVWTKRSVLSIGANQKKRLLEFWSASTYPNSHWLTIQVENFQIQQKVIKKTKVNSPTEKQKADAKNNIFCAVYKYSQSKSQEHWYIHYKIINKNPFPLYDVKVKYLIKDKSGKVIYTIFRVAARSIKGNQTRDAIGVVNKKKYPGFHLAVIQIISFKWTKKQVYK